MMTSYLTKEELENLKKYKHHAGKTTLETFYIEKVFNHVEPLFPSVSF
jgi:hypothetical protein